GPRRRGSGADDARQASPTPAGPQPGPSSRRHRFARGPGRGCGRSPPLGRDAQGDLPAVVDPSAWTVVRGGLLTSPRWLGMSRRPRRARRGTPDPVDKALPRSGPSPQRTPNHGPQTMKAIVFHGVGDIRLENVSDPKIQEPSDAIVRLTASAICGTDLHFVRGTVPGMVPGTILGHEGVGIVEEVGADVRNVQPGDRVVITSTIACGSCSYCRAGYQSQCDKANPNGPQAGTSFFGGPKETGPFQGLQAERARIPFANVGMVR